MSTKLGKYPIIFLHGALGAASQMEPLATALSTSFNVSCLDFEGHGGLPLPSEPFSILRFSQNLLVWVNEQGWEKVDLFGFSMGGYVALDFASHYPERVNSIAMLGTKFDWTSATAARESALLDPEKWELKIPFFAEMLALRHDPQDWKVVVKKTAQMMLHLGDGGALSPAQLASIVVPVLILRGALDNMVSEAESLEAVGHLSNGIFKMLPDTKHPFEQINVALLAEYLTEFFRNGQ